MEASVLAAVGCLTAFASAGLLGAAFAGRQGAVARARVGRGIGGRDLLSRVVSRGIVWSRPVACAALSHDWVRCWSADVARMLERRGLPATAEGACSCAVAALAALFVGGWVLAGPLAGCALSAFASALVATAVRRDRERGAEELRDATPEALRSLGACFQAGLSLLQTFRQVGGEIDGALGASFHRAAHVLETGGTVPEALAGLKEGASAEMAFVAVALDIQHTSGGSMRQVLDAAGDSVASEMELRRSMRVQTAQAKLSARIVSVMPFALIAVFSLTTEDFLEPFFSSVAGMGLLALAVALQVSGIVLVRRVLTVGEV